MGSSKTDTAYARQTLAEIAEHYLRVETLETRKNDGLDFYDLNVADIKAALEAAYRAGFEQGRIER